MDAAGLVTRTVADFVDAHLPPGAPVCVALSGGADSSALVAGALRAGLPVCALVVDHGLQDGSAGVAAAAADTARRLGASAQVLTVEVGTAGGLEAAARDARYVALDDARDGRPVLLGHTADDQAETVLLGLARGSGARSIAGMRPWREPWGRPLLGIRRTDTVTACAELGLQPHHDPHNDDRRFTRVRLRSEVLPLLDDVLHGGVVDALGRTANALQADLDALDALADTQWPAASVDGELDVETIRGVPTAIRTRVVRRWLLAVGATEPTHRVISAVDALVTDERSRGHVAIGGDPTARRVVIRSGQRLTVRLVER
ncbi:tRNA lysidine(34) synthetase TilS [Gordonia insulae]|uniref:tRNA(Ile)-lysidine synthase n=1 Tax=Gordonia insulae TaxID=2420509 RepID=A0A3G8JRT1_9ACTN|nr:tRNA lysidine(34) synthetase TilS [Gordonia insulae]AZG47854.1 tRNA(Ile)-lysidine synthase [Gordonia insulae]